MVVKDADGYPTINASDGGLVLTVFPPQGRGKKLTFDALRREMGKYNAAGIKWETVKQVVEQASGRPMMLVPPKSKDGDAQVFVQVSDDEMQATLTVLPPERGGKNASLEKVRETLGMNGVTFGVLEDEMKKLEGELAKMASPDQVFEPLELVIAKGKPVVNGENARLETLYHSTPEPSEVPMVEDSEGRVDYRQVSTIENVAKGTVLARKLLATPGEAGMTVTGRQIPPKAGDDVKIAAGQGVVVSAEDENTFVADADGQVVFKDNKLQVLALYEINGDLTMSIGNIDFVGSVIVHGGVPGEFKIKCGEDLLVEGVLDGAEVNAGGKVTVKGGIIGQKTRVVAEGEVSSKYIRNAHVESGKNIIVNDAAMHSTLIAGEKILVIGAKGLLVGGSSIAGVEVSAKEMGAKMATPTEIEVGENPRLREESQRVEQEMRGLEDQLDKAKKGIAFLKDMSQKLGDKMPADKKEMLSKLIRTQFKLMGDLKGVQERKAKVVAAENEMKTTKRGKVSCLGMIYPGVKITISKASRAISEELKYCTLVEDDGEIKVLPYK